MGIVFPGSRDRLVVPARGEPVVDKGQPVVDKGQPAPVWG
jgi:hypothetical protein